MSRTQERPALEVKGLKLVFHTYAGDVKALDGVDIDVKKGEILGLVGESGCGKSVTALSIAGLLPENARIIAGELMLEGKDLLKLKKDDMRHARMKDIAFVFQDPLTYLNPVLTIGSQLTEGLTDDKKAHLDALVALRLSELDGALKLNPMDEKSAKEKEALKARPMLGRRERARLARVLVTKYLRLVRLPEPEQVFKMYPFELSGGMRQRAMIAMALVRRPKVLLADEITTALDVTVQAQILELLKGLRDEIDAAIILITHDLAVVAEVCDRVAVMYAGNIVEVAPVDVFFSNPMHPYSVGLMAAVPRPDRQVIKLESIQGTVPDLIHPPTGCRFHPRCPRAFDRCPQVKPPLIETEPGHKVACLLFGG
ncbi:MAG: ABC transporter ATP-binding protein [Thaumarchaeota archaeon]|nr:ABC transporter ATP-binding protein [Nitrososphaerota archaeon]